MTIPGSVVPLLIFSLMTVSASAQKIPQPQVSKPKTSRVMTGSAAKGAASAGMQVAPDLDQRLARFRRVRMPFQSAGLTAREQKLVKKLVDASRYLEEIFWRQIDPEALTLYQSLASSKNPKDQKLRRYLWINASRFDLLDQNKPFVGTASIPPGRGFYPQGLTREQIEQYVKDHPEKKAEIYSPTTVVRWHGDQLEGLPYHIAYRSFLEPAARDLREAAALSADPAFANFLRLRADALLSDDYFKSDLAWLDLKDPKFDIIFAPYETYDDGLLGVKATYGAAVLIRNSKESQKLAMFQKYVADIQDALPLAAENRPNDPRVHEQKGSKKIFFKNFMDARVNFVILPVAKRVLRPEQATKVSGEAYLLATIMHEMAHGLGPAFARTAAGKTDIREAIGPVFAGLEEAKADVVGMFGLKWLMDHDALPKEKLEEYYASYVGGIFRTVRFGAAEAHSQAELMEFNYLSERGAIQREPSGRYSIDYARMPQALADLAKELLEIEATGDRERAEGWFKKYGVMPHELQSSLKSAANVPVDIDPIFSFAERVR